MGLADAFNDEPHKFVRAYMEARHVEERERRGCQERRWKLLHGPSDDVLNEEIGNTHTDPETKARLKKFSRLAKAQAPFKRFVHELARVVYAVQPVRQVEPVSESAAWSMLLREVRLNERMDTALRWCLAQNHSFLYPRYVPRLKRIVCKVIPAHCMKVIPDPDDPTSAIAYGYDYSVIANGKHAYRRIWVDDTVFWQTDNDDRPLTAPEKHNYPIIPIVPLHLWSDRGDVYWDIHSGEEQEAADLQNKIVEIWKLRALKSQAFRQRVHSGPSHNFPHGQALDPENVMLAGEGGSISELGGSVDMDAFLKSEETTATTAAAQRGISRSRLNQDKADGSDDTGLMEWRADLLKIVTQAEYDVFDVLKMMSEHHDDRSRRLAVDTTLAYLDFGEIQHRVDRLKQLQIRKEERSMGLRSWLDDIIEDQPETQGDYDKAEEEGLRNMEREAKFVEKRRALQIPENVSMEEPGAAVATTGALGPMVRDGQITRDQAAEIAAKGPNAAQPDLRAIVRDALRRTNAADAG